MLTITANRSPKHSFFFVTIPPWTDCQNIHIIFLLTACDDASAHPANRLYLHKVVLYFQEIYRKKQENLCFLRYFISMNKSSFFEQVKGSISSQTDVYGPNYRQEIG